MTIFSEVPQFILTEFFSTEFFSILEKQKTLSNSAILDNVIIANEITEIDLVVKTKSFYKKIILSGITSISENYIYFSSEDINSPSEISEGDEIYFQKNGAFYTYIKQNRQYQDYVNYNKNILYVGNIYHPHPSYYIIKFYNLYDYVKSSLPEYITNNNPKLNEYLYEVFNKKYSLIYGKQKNINSLISPLEIDKNFLYNYAYNFGLNIKENFILNHSEKLRQFFDNITMFLKLKGTYTSININKQIIFFNSLNKLNIYDEWHSREITGNAEPYFEDVNILNYYTKEKYKNYWDNFTILDESSIVMSKQKGTIWNVFHLLNTSNLIPLCLDTNGFVIKPKEIQIISNNLIQVSFDELTEGFLLCVKADTFETFSPNETIYFDYENVFIPVSSFSEDNFKIFLDNVAVYGDNTLELTGKTLSSVTSLATSANEIYYQTELADQWELDLENTAVIPNVWLNAPDTLWHIAHNLSTSNLIVQCYDFNHQQIFPKSITLFDTYVECEFAHIQEGYALLAEGTTEEFNSESLFWNFVNEEIKIEQIYSDNTLINPKKLYNENVTFSKPTSGKMIFCDYDYIENISEPLNTWNINHNLDSKNNIVETYIFEASDEWIITHNIGNTNYLFEVFDEDNKKMFFSSVDIQDNLLIISFDTPAKGYVCISSDNRNTFTETLPISADQLITTNIPHYLSYNKLFINNEEWLPNTLKTSFNKLEIFNSVSTSGVAVISDADFIYEQENLSNIWGISHPFDTKYVLSEFYTKDFKYTGDVWTFEHGLGDVIASVYDKNTKEQLLPWEVDLINNNQIGVDTSIIDFNTNIESGWVSFLPGVKLWQNLTDYNWELNHSFGHDNLLTEFFNTSGNKILPNSVNITSTEISASFTTREYGYCVAQEADYIETFTSETSANITHNLESENILAQAINLSGEKVLINNVTVIDKNNVYVEFDSIFSGNILIAEGESAIQKVLPETVTNNEGIVIAEFNENIDGFAVIKLAEKYENYYIINELEKNITNIDNNNCSIEFAENKRGICLIKKPDLLGMNLELCDPKSIQLNNDKLKINFDEETTGVVTYKEIGNISTGKILSPHLKLEIDVSNQPEADNAILPKTETDYLINRWEEDKPVCRYYHYDILFSPLFNLNSSISQNLYNTDLYKVNCWSKLYSPIYTPSDETYLHTQTYESNIWTFTHSLSNDAIISIYNFNNEKIYPESIYQKDNYIEIKFPSNKSGYVLCTKADDIYEKTLLSQGSVFSQSISANDVLLNDNIYDYDDGNFVFDETTTTITPSASNAIIDYYQINNKIQYPSVEYNEDLSEVTLTFGTELKGKYLIDYGSILFEQSTEALTWIVNHNFGVKGVLVTVLNDDNQVIRPEKIKLNTENILSISFNTPMKGKVLIKAFGNIETEDSLSYRLENAIYKIGTGTSEILYNPLYTNDLENPILSTTISEVNKDDLISTSYFESNEEHKITEFGIIDSFSNDILCYSYFDKLYKYNKANLKIKATFRSI